jgi:hypothetical protein
MNPEINLKLQDLINKEIEDTNDMVILSSLSDASYFLSLLLEGLIQDSEGKRHVISCLKKSGSLNAAEWVKIINN